MSWRTVDQSNNDMVDKFVRLGIIQSKTVEAAFRCVSRAAFVPEELIDEAFFDAPIRGEPNLHMSAPHMYASILEDLELEPGMSFLNIGSGTGYFSSLVGYMIKADGINHGIELHGDLVQYANERIDDLMQFGPYDTKEICRPLFISGNCFQLDPDQMKYERLYCGAACPLSKVKFLMEFLKVGGFLIAPVGPRLIKIEKLSVKEGAHISMFEVCFASLIMPSPGELSLPKLRFPQVPRKAAMKRAIRPAVRFLCGKSESKRTLAKLRALSVALDCFHNGSDLPVALCYVPSFEQVNALRTLLCKDSVSRSVSNSLLMELGTNHSRRSSSRLSCSGVLSNDIWEHLAADKTWEIVCQSWFSFCATSHKRQLQCLDLTVKLPRAHVPEYRKCLAKSQPAKCVMLYPSNLTANLLLADSMDAEAVVANAIESALRTILDDDTRESNDSSQLEFDLFQSSDDVSSTLSTLESQTLSEASNIVTTSLETASGSVCDQKSGHDYTTVSSLGVSGSNNETIKRKKSTKANLIQLKMEKELVRTMAMHPGKWWTKQHDVQLIALIAKLKAAPRLTKQNGSAFTALKPELFRGPIAQCFPMLETVPAWRLCYRAVALLRIASIVDSVLVHLTGSTMSKKQFANPFHDSYLLPSFDNESFLSSGATPCVAQLLPHRTLDCSSPQREKRGEVAEKVDYMIVREMGNVQHRRDMIVEKIRLFDSLDAQFKDQLELLRQQIDLIEEQQQLLCNIHVDGLDSEKRQQLLKTQSILLERKQYRQQLMERQREISDKQETQSEERKELVWALEQLVLLENQLIKEQAELAQQGETYVAKDDCELEGLQAYMKKSDELLHHLQVQPTSSVEEKSTELLSIPCYVEKGHDAKDLSATQLSVNRYHPEAILRQCQTFLPLSVKRWTIVKELLRSSELAPPKYLPILSIDRQTPLEERHIHLSLRSVFMQAFIGLKGKDVHYRWNKKSYEQWWEVKFHGEGIIDQGGGFRDSLVEIAEELCPAASNIDSCLPLFVKTPNQRDSFGDYRSCYTPNPSCTQWHLFHWVGQLMGAAFRTDETLPVSLAPFVWKVIVGGHVTWKDDFTTVDVAAVEMLDGLETMQSEIFDSVYGDSQFFVASLSNGVITNLMPGGDTVAVENSNRKQFAELSRKARMLESSKQLKAIRDGLLSTIPECVLTCITWEDLERGVCGEQEISMADLKENCRFGSELNVASVRVVYLWTALQEFSNEDRSRFIRFVTGRKRLPSPFIVSCSADHQDSLPTASTCASSLFLPDYSSVKVAVEKLRYAINNCVAIDTDTSPWN